MAACTVSAALRNSLARRLRDAKGLYRSRVKPSGKIYRRRPKHRLRALAETIA
jgi:hypothetical protein